MSTSDGTPECDNWFLDFLQVDFDFDSDFTGPSFDAGQEASDCKMSLEPQNQVHTSTPNANGSQMCTTVNHDNAIDELNGDQALGRVESQLQDWDAIFDDFVRNSQWTEKGLVYDVADNAPPAFNPSTTLNMASYGFPLQQNHKDSMVPGVESYDATMSTIAPITRMPPAANLPPPRLTPTQIQQQNKGRRRRRQPIKLSNILNLSAAPIIHYPFDAAYEGKPLVPPTIPSKDVARVNANYKAHSQYPRPVRAPRPWGPFRYNCFGELDPAQTFTAEEIRRFLFDHPLHYNQDPRTSRLQILFQQNPAYSRHRYPGESSHRCRFANCPLPKINQGQLQVQLNEGTHADPFISAGYVHLWCLERYCNLPQICANLNVSADYRLLEQESDKRNRFRMASTSNKLTNELSPEERQMQEFIVSCRAGMIGPNFARYDSETWQYEYTLTYMLSETKRLNEPSSIARQRERRVQQAGYRGCTLAEHKGNLPLETYLRQKTRLHKNQNQLTPKPLRARTYHAMLQEEEADSEEELYQALTSMTSTSKKRTHDWDEVEDADAPTRKRQQHTISAAPLAFMSPEQDLEALQANKEKFENQSF